MGEIYNIFCHSWYRVCGIIIVSIHCDVLWCGLLAWVVLDLFEGQSGLLHFAKGPCRAYLNPLASGAEVGII